MALPAKVLKVTMYGTLYSAQDWSTSFWLKVGDTATDPSPSDVSTLLQGIWGQTGSLGSVFQGHNYTATNLQGLRGYYYGAGGPHASQIGEYVLATPLAGTQTASGPALLSMVCSLRTNQPGRSGRGRMYWPWTANPGYDATGRFPTTNTDSMSSQLGTTFRNINLIDGSLLWYKSLQVVVASATKAASYPVTTLQVDNVVDTQHRRVDKLGATHISTATL